MDVIDNFLNRVDHLAIGRRGDRIAPHKPLYLLQCISALQKNFPRLRSFAELQPELAQSLRFFGRPTGGVNPEYPFWRLQNDGLAEVVYDGKLTMRKSNTDPTVKTLLENNARGGLRAEYYDVLQGCFDFQVLAVTHILNNYFAPDIHDVVVGFFDIQLRPMLEPPDSGQGEAYWDANYREQVVSAYGGRCAISGTSAVVGGVCIGVDATPLFWPTTSAHLTVSDAIAASTVHAKLYHVGALALDDEYRILVSSQYKEVNDRENTLRSLAGRQIQLPEEACDYPNQDAARQHRRWVFKG